MNGGVYIQTKELRFHPFCMPLSNDTKHNYAKNWTMPNSGEKKLSSSVTLAPCHVLSAKMCLIAIISNSAGLDVWYYKIAQGFEVVWSLSFKVLLYYLVN